MRINVEDGSLRRFARDLRDTGEFSREGRRHLIEGCNRRDFFLKRFSELYGLTFFGALGGIFIAACNYNSNPRMYFAVGSINLMTCLPLFYSLFRNKKDRDYVKLVRGVANQQRHINYCFRIGFKPNINNAFTLDRI